MSQRYWIGVASREHVKRGVAGGFSQLGHGKSLPLKRMVVGDWLIYYSPRERFDETAACQKFTAIGKVVGENVYPFEMSPGFVPYRRDVCFLDADDVPIRPLIDQLSFIHDRSRWGYAFRFGHLEIMKSDFEVIATSMLGYIPTMDEKIQPTVQFLNGS